MALCDESDTIHFIGTALKKAMPVLMGNNRIRVLTSNEVGIAFTTVVARRIELSVRLSVTLI